MRDIREWRRDCGGVEGAVGWEDGAVGGEGRRNFVVGMWNCGKNFISAKFLSMGTVSHKTLLWKKGISWTGENKMSL